MASDGRRSDPDRQTVRLLNDRVSSSSTLRPLGRPRPQRSPRRAADRGVLPMLQRASTDAVGPTPQADGAA